VIEIRDFSKSYDGNLVLEIPNRSISTGIHTLSGKNGSGKTTLLKCIAGILPFEGSIAIDGRANDRENKMEYLKLVRYSPAELVFPSFLKSTDLISFYSSLLQAQTSEVNHLVSEFGVDKYKEVEIGQYSSGMIGTFDAQQGKME